MYKDTNYEIGIYDHNFESSSIEPMELEIMNDTSLNNCPGVPSCMPPTFEDILNQPCILHGSSIGC